MKMNLARRSLYLYVPLGLMAIGLGMQTYSAYQRHALGEVVLYGAAFSALQGWALSLVIYWERVARLRR